MPQRRDRRLQRDRPADPFGCRDRLVGVVHEVRRHDLDADRREQDRPPAPGPAPRRRRPAVSHPATSLRAVACVGTARVQRQSSVDGPPLRVPCGPAEREDPVLGRAVGGHRPGPAGLVVGRQLGCHTVQLVHAGDRRASCAGCRGGELRLEHRVGSTDGRDAHRDDDVTLRVVVQLRDRVADLLGVGVLGQQDDASGRDEACGGRGLRHERSGRRRAGQDRGTPARRERLVRQDLRHVEELVRVVDADDTGLAHHLGQRARSGVRRPDRVPGRHHLARPSGRHHDHGLELRQPPGHPAELARVADRLEVEPHDVGAVVVRPELHEVVARDVRAMPRGDELRQADPAPTHGSEQCHSHRRRLAEQPDPPSARRRLRRGRRSATSPRDVRAARTSRGRRRASPSRGRPGAAPVAVPARRDRPRRTRRTGAPRHGRRAARGLGPRRRPRRTAPRRRRARRARGRRRGRAWERPGRRPHGPRGPRRRRAGRPGRLQRAVRGRIRPRPPGPTTTTDLASSSCRTDRASARCSRSAITASDRSVGSMSKLERDDAVLGALLDDVPGLPEHRDHATVLRQDLGDEPSDATFPGRRREVLEQHRSQAAALVRVRDVERHLRVVVVDPVVTRHADDLLGPADVRDGDERHPVDVVDGDEALQVPLGQSLHGGEEPQVRRPLRLGDVERLQRVGVGRQHGPDVRRRPVVQHDVRLPPGGVGRSVVSDVGHVRQASATPCAPRPVRGRRLDGPQWSPHSSPSPRSTNDGASPRDPRRPTRRRRRTHRRHRRRDRDGGLVPRVRVLGHLLPGPAGRP